jgi:predicted ATPase
MFEVEWIEAAVTRLASAWLRADPIQRGAITAASHLIDETLASNPIDAGESRDANRRIFIADPLAAIYGIDEDRKVVTVLDVLVRTPRSA